MVELSLRERGMLNPAPLPRSMDRGLEVFERAESKIRDHITIEDRAADLVEDIYWERRQTAELRHEKSEIEDKLLREREQHNATKRALAQEGKMVAFLLSLISEKFL